MIGRGGAENPGDRSERWDVGCGLRMLERVEQMHRQYAAIILIKRRLSDNTLEKSKDAGEVSAGSASAREDHRRF
jgi:hypothetical protein